ncbi:NAD(P)-binding protein [Aspergillus ellipticus CBS 707.79]|uniref:NAD(P)-binding protein n=1 Tax=Aspergillus ellipticus CBS 707.79 TaxID=1448320 RepID=A0A319CV74_9EURO|nr:NAD(P)-binding protein [Aspergillus ellipticus CBS 707.79]
MPFNRIAVYGHRGWASSAIVKALAGSGAPVRVLHRPGSDTRGLPANVEIFEVELTDRASLVDSLRDIDIVICLVGHGGVPLEHHFVEAIPKTQVQLLVPSDLAARYDEQGNRIPVHKNKALVEKAARQAGIPTTVVLPGNFAEFALSTPAMGVDHQKNRIQFVGDSATEPLNLCTRAYVGAAYANIFASTPISQLKDRDIALSEFRVTGNEIAEALTQKFNASTLSKSDSKKHIIQDTDEAIEKGHPFALALYCRKIWATGEQVKMNGDDVWDVEGYPKATISGTWSHIERCLRR